jgi:glycosyltransferase involved in cell wall biosynthesis
LQGKARVTPRLLVVIGSLAAEGTPVLTLELCRRWRAMGIEPTVVSLSAADRDLEPEFAREGIPVRVMGFPNSGRTRYARMVGWMYSACRELRPAALLSMPFGWHAFLALGARAAGVRSVVAHVGNYPSPRDRLSFSKFRLLVQAGRPLTRKLVCCSAYVARGVTEQLGVPESETEVIYNGADVHSIARRSDAARNGSGRRGRAVVGMVARLEIHKDQPVLIRAAKLLRDAGREIEVWLIGEGSRRVEYERLIAELGLTDTVKLLGMRRDIPELLGQLDLFAFAATPDEGQGVALVEAMAAGVPIVATDVGACREVLEHGELGALVPPQQPEALATAIESALLAREQTAAQVAHARAKAFSLFTIDSMASAYARTLQLPVQRCRRETSSSLTF